MDDELLARLYHRLFGDPSLRYTPGCTFGDAAILLIHLYAVLTNRSHRWAHDKRHWPLWCRRIQFPSYSQLMKRLGWPSIAQRIVELNHEFRSQLPTGDQKV